MTFSHEEFNRFILENDVVGFFDQPITLKSGQKSHWYANWRTVAGDVYLVDRLSDLLIAFLEQEGIEFDIIYGVPDGATKLGVVAQFKWASRRPGYARNSHVLLMGRSAPKGHGLDKDRLFLGEPKGRVVVVEDVTTTGGSLMESIRMLGQVGAEVVAAVGLTNRMQRREDGLSVEQAVAQLDVKYYAMSDATELLPMVVNKKNPGDAVKTLVCKEFEQYGVKPLKL